MIKKEFKVLFVDDNKEQLDILMTFFHNKEYDTGQSTKIKLLAKAYNSFDDAINECTKDDSFDLVVLDLMNGDVPTDETGFNVFDVIKNHFFCPIIFYSGAADINTTLKDYSTSLFIDTIQKDHNSINILDGKIKSIIEDPSSLIFLKRRIIEHLTSELKNFFWNHVHGERESITNYGSIDYSLNYMFMKKLAHSLSKSKIKELTCDDLIENNKTHPMEFYVYPTFDGDYEPGEILKSNSNSVHYVLLTPACDLVKDRYKVDNVLLAEAMDLAKLEVYKKHQDIDKLSKTESKNTRNELKNIITNNSNKSYFIPKTYFIPNLVVKFDKTISTTINELGTKFSRIAKLDDPFAQQLITKFTNCYNRIGTPDIDVDYILSDIK